MAAAASEGRAGPAEAAEEKIRSFLLENGEWHGRAARLTDDLQLVHNVLDSVGFLMLVGMIETQLGIWVGEDELVPANFGSLGSLLSFVRERLATKAGEQL